MSTSDYSNLEDLDRSKIHTSLKHFPDQCLQGWDETMKLSLPEDYKDINKIVTFAMGGSVLGAMICHHAYLKDLKIPFHFYSGYDIPAYVDENTLCIIVSVSGSTEETIASYNQAREKTKKIITITKGSKLGEQSAQDNFPMYRIDDSEFNPSGVPRVAVGFQIGAYLAILAKLGLIDLNESEFKKIIENVRNEGVKLAPESKTDKNEAKQIAAALKEKIAIIVTSEHLCGAGKAMNNQTNESGKHFSTNFELPDVNHHQLEGMEFPKSNPQNLIYFTIESSLYHARNSKRYEILKVLLDDLGISHISYNCHLTSKLEQALEVFQLGSYMTYYLGLLHDVDPAPNPFVDKFKELLGK